MSSHKQDRQEDKARKAIYAGNPGIRRDVWDYVTRLTNQSDSARRGISRQPAANDS